MGGLTESTDRDQPMIGYLRRPSDYLVDGHANLSVLFWHGRHTMALNALSLGKLNVRDLWSNRSFGQHPCCTDGETS